MALLKSRNPITNYNFDKCEKQFKEKKIVSANVLKQLDINLYLTKVKEKKKLNLSSIFYLRKAIPVTPTFHSHCPVNLSTSSIDSQVHWSQLKTLGHHWEGSRSSLCPVEALEAAPTPQNCPCASGPLHHFTAKSWQTPNQTKLYVVSVLGWKLCSFHGVRANNMSRSPVSQTHVP